VLESISTARDWLNSEMRFQVEKALDAHCFSQIVAASPPFGTTGADTITKVRNAIASMRAEGANPDLLVMNATDAAALDLSTSGTGTPYLFAIREPGGASPLFGLRVVERTSAAGNEPPYVLDSNMLGRLYLGSLRIEADPFTGFTKNLTTLRCEVKALFHVRNAKGARRIAAS
jgi:HK97 family phage major capsid protein